MDMSKKKLEELVLQSLEHEMGGTQIYEKAIACAVNSDLKKEWSKYLKETEQHVKALVSLCESLGLDPEKETPGRDVVRKAGAGLLEVMEMASAAGDETAAQLVACECVVLAETKDHLNWELLGKCVDLFDAETNNALKHAYDEVEDQEDEHLYHSKGWCRELWLESLGVTAVLPPPEERRDVKTAIGAARAEQAADRLR
jgi:hypothetical protein